MKWIFVILSLILVEVYGIKIVYHRVKLDADPNEKNYTGRIVGGTATTIGAYPYQAQILYGNSHICGGSVISTKSVLCAAHCLDGSMSQYTIRVGTSSRNKGGTLLKVVKMLRHPSYNADTYDFDVAMFTVDKPMTGLASVVKIPLRNANENMAPGTPTICTGWGTVKESGSVSSTLQVVTLKCISNTDCDRMYGTGTITRNMLCTLENGKDSCQGDSGGPLMARIGNVNKLVGIVSWGAGCARANAPGVYTDVTSPPIRSFIDTQLAAEKKMTNVVVKSKSLIAESFQTETPVKSGRSHSRRGGRMQACKDWDK